MNIQWNNIFKSILLSVAIILILVSPLGDHFKVGYLGYPGETMRITRLSTGLGMLISLSLFNYFFYFRKRETKNYSSEWKRKEKNKEFEK